jgi:hypothetical protein
MHKPQITLNEKGLGIYYLVTGINTSPLYQQKLSGGMSEVFIPVTKY